MATSTTLPAIAILAVLATAIHSAPIQTADSQQNAENPNVVPGVFISADTLKDLQNQVQQNNQDSDGKIGSPEGEDVTPNSLAIQGNQPIANQQPLLYQQQPLTASQGPVYQQQQPQYVNQQPQYSTQPPQYINQQPQYQVPQYDTQQLQQPYYQQQIVGNPPTQLLNGQQPITYGNQPFNRPQYPIGQQAVLPNQQQPIYQQPPIGNQPSIVYPNGQQPIGNQPTLIYQDGQSLVPQSQPTNPPILIYPSNQNQQVPAQNQPGNLYTLVPVNSGNTVPNSNLQGGGAYLPQQLPNQGPIYALNSNGK